MENSAQEPQVPTPPPEFDWKEAFNIAASQRDDATRNLQNFQIQSAVERKAFMDRIAELEKLVTSLQEK